MPFQRSYSKVWWGSDNQLSSYPSVLSSNTTASSSSNNNNLSSSNSIRINNNNNNNNNNINEQSASNSLPSSGFYYSYNHNHHYQRHQNPYFSQQNSQCQSVHLHPLHSAAQQSFNGGYDNDYDGNSDGGAVSSISGYHSLDYNSLRTFSGNLSRIQEVDDEQNQSKLSWEKHDSPGSLRSQDSGFSDNDESHSTRSLGGRSSKTASPSSKYDTSAKSAANTPSSSHTIATPPTVIRRVGRSEFYSPLVSVSRRISFSGSPASTAAHSASGKKTDKRAIEGDIEDVASSTLNTTMQQLLNEESYSGGSSKANIGQEIEDMNEDENGSVNALERAIRVPRDAVKYGKTNKTKTKRRRCILRTPTKPLTKKGSLAIDTNSAEGAIETEEEGANKEYYSETGNSSDDELDLELENKHLRQTPNKVPEYNNETVYLGAMPSASPAPLPKPKSKSNLNPSYNNETVILGNFTTEEAENTNNDTLSIDNNHNLTPLKANEQYMASTSTPKLGHTSTSVTEHKSPPHEIRSELDYFLSSHYAYAPINRKFSNPLLNGHQPDMLNWLYELRRTYDHEVMSTLQAKSIVQEAFKNLTITTSSVAKLIRQLQQRALYLQADFERIERILQGEETATLQDALTQAERLLGNVSEFTKVLERRSLFFDDSRSERRRHETSLEQIRIVTRDTQYSLERHHYINLESLLDDVQVLKRYLLIAVRQVFSKMVYIIVHSIEHNRNEMILRANINMVATLTNMDYEGFASLTDAFVQSEAVRALLIVCIESKSSSLRAQSLRALATVCSVPEAISQLTVCGGVEIIRDILNVPNTLSRKKIVKRSDAERREAVSLLTQITAAWHGSEHYVSGLKDCAESIVAGLTQLIKESHCSQILLLCAAALNNLSRMEITSHYSIMSNEAIFRLIDAVAEMTDEDVSIFLYEQIVAMLHNMSLNKKCHSHLANEGIINFITSVYQMEFYKSYSSRAETDAQRRLIKAILHTLTRLVQDANIIGGNMFGAMANFTTTMKHDQQQQQQQQQQHMMPALLKLIMSHKNFAYGFDATSGTFSTDFCLDASQNTIRNDDELTASASASTSSGVGHIRSHLQLPTYDDERHSHDMELLAKELKYEQFKLKELQKTQHQQQQQQQQYSVDNESEQEKQINCDLNQNINDNIEMPRYCESAIDIGRAQRQSSLKQANQNNNNNNNNYNINNKNNNNINKENNEKNNKQMENHVNTIKKVEVECEKSGTIDDASIEMNDGFSHKSTDVTQFKLANQESYI